MHDTYNVYNQTTMRTWMNTPDRPEGMNQRGKNYFLELKQIDQEFKRNNVILYFLVTRHSVNDLRKAMYSGKKQRQLIYSVMEQLKAYQVSSKWERVFQRDIRNLANRADYVLLIIRENLRLTEMYPFFEAAGFERLIDFGIKYAEGDDDAADQLQREMDEWNAGHQEDIRRHMEETEEERQNRDKRRQKIAEDRASEKLAKRLAKKAAKAEAREIRENHRKYESRRKRVERSFDRYYK